MDNVSGALLHGALGGTYGVNVALHDGAQQLEDPRVRVRHLADALRLARDVGKGNQRRLLFRLLCKVPQG